VLQKKAGLWTPSIVLEDMEKLTGFAESQRHVIRGNNFRTYLGTEAQCVLDVNVELCGDVEIRFFHKSKNSAKYTKSMSSLHNPMTLAQIFKDVPYPMIPLFRYIFHTSMIQEERIFVSAPDLDSPYAGAVITSDQIPSSITIEFIFDPICEFKSPAPLSIGESGGENDGIGNVEGVKYHTSVSRANAMRTHHSLGSIQTRSRAEHDKDEDGVGSGSRGGGEEVGLAMGPYGPIGLGIAHNKPDIHHRYYST